MNTLNVPFKNNQKHPFHLVDPSPWPFVTSVGAFSMAIGFAMYVHAYSGGLSCFFTGFSTILFVMFVWWRDIVREATFEGQHTAEVQIGMRWGMLLFIASEVMFFLPFFGLFFIQAFLQRMILGVFIHRTVLMFYHLGKYRYLTL
jgi:hypothetical protein